MFKVEFGVVHRGCLVNEVSRELPKLRIICPGGFVRGDSVEEVIVLDGAGGSEVAAVIKYLEASPKVVEVEMLEQTRGKTFIRFVTTSPPEEFCSRVVEKHHGFPLGMEVQRGGVEMWRVGVARREQAQGLLDDIEALGEVKHASISETSWEELLMGGAADEE